MLQKGAGNCHAPFPGTVTTRVHSQRLRFNPVQVDHPPLTPWAHPPHMFFYHGKVLENFCLNPGHMPLESPLLK